MAPAAPIYRAPQPAAPFPALTSGTRWVYAFFVVLGIVGFTGAVLLWTIAVASDPNRPDDTLMGAGFVLLVGTILLVYAHAITGLVWVYRAYSWLPWDQRWTRQWRGWIQPSQAALFLLIPYFQYYWMFVVNLGLCEALDRMRVTYGTREPAPRNLALAASICQLLVPMPVGMILWLLYMTRIEKMTQEMSAGAAARGRYAY